MTTIVYPVTIDCSRWNCLNFTDHPDDTGIDFTKLASKVDTVVIRSSIGHQEDVRFQQIYDGLLPFAQTGQISLAVYHGFIPSLSLQGQVDLVEELLEDKPLIEFVMADFELNPSNINRFALADMFIDFLDGIEQQVDVLAWVYTADWFWGPNIGDARAADFAEYPLMFAHYTADFNDLYIPYPWRPWGWAKHQYSADGNGLGAFFGFPSDDIDLSRDNDGQTVPVECGLRMTPNTAVNIRTGPSVQYPAVGKATVGEEVTAYELVVENANPIRVWARVTPGESPDRWMARIYQYVVDGNIYVYLE